MAARAGLGLSAHARLGHVLQNPILAQARTCLFGSRLGAAVAGRTRSAMFPVGSRSGRGARQPGIVCMSLEVPKGDDLLDDAMPSPKFNRESFAENFVEDKEVMEREGRVRKPRASPREAYLGSVVIMCTSALSYMLMQKALGAVELMPGDVVAAAAAQPVVEAMVLGTGTLATSMFFLNAIGLFAFGVQQQLAADEPMVYYRCDGSDPQCCSGSPRISYLSNYRGYETSVRRRMDRHLKKRTGCCEIEPVIVMPDKALPKQDADLN